MSVNAFELELIRSPDDPPLFSRELQAELEGIAREIPEGKRPLVRNDSVDVVGGGLDYFLFQTAVALVHALGVVGAEWLAARDGRQVRVKTPQFEIEARNPEECKEIYEFLKEREDMKGFQEGDGHSV